MRVTSPSYDWRRTTKLVQKTWRNKRKRGEMKSVKDSEKVACKTFRHAQSDVPHFCKFFAMDWLLLLLVYDWGILGLSTVLFRLQTFERSPGSSSFFSIFPAKIKQERRARHNNPTYFLKIKIPQISQLSTSFCPSTSVYDQCKNQESRKLSKWTIDTTNRSNPQLDTRHHINIRWCQHIHQSWNKMKAKKGV